MMYDHAGIQAAIDAGTLTGWAARDDEDAERAEWCMINWTHAWASEGGPLFIRRLKQCIHCGKIARA